MSSLNEAIDRLSSGDIYGGIITFFAFALPFSFVFSVFIYSLIHFCKFCFSFIKKYLERK